MRGRGTVSEKAERSLRAATAANVRWSRRTLDQRREDTQAARDAGLRQFEDQVDPSVTDPDDRAAMAENLRRAHMQRMTLKSIQARKAAKLERLARQWAALEDEFGGDAA